MNADKRYEPAYDISELMETYPEDWPVDGDLIPILRKYRYDDNYYLLSDEIYGELVADALHWIHHRHATSESLLDIPDDINDITREQFGELWPEINRSRLYSFRAMMDQIDHLLLQGDVRKEEII